MTNGFLPIVLFAGVIAAFAVMSLGLPRLVTTRRPTRAKRSPYESGVTPARLPARSRFQVKFYIVAMLFILFDIEAIFLYPWAVAFRQLGLFGLIEMAVFIALLFVAYVFVLRKGGLDWTAEDVDAVASTTAATGAATEGNGHAG
jgi:NADH-quinone oxidoreductase subunit A